MSVCRCKLCRKTTDQISEYVDAGKLNSMTPEEYVKQEEGTYNKNTGLFYCTKCYVKAGMPLGKA